MSQHRASGDAPPWLMERDLRRPGGGGATWSVTFNGYFNGLNMPPLNEASDLFIEILEELGSVWPAEVLSVVHLLSSVYRRRSRKYRGTFNEELKEFIIFTNTFLYIWI